MALWRLYYHFVWTTKNRLPLIIPQKEVILHRYIIGKADALNCLIHALGGTEDHLHLVASIPPQMPISEFVKKIKGSSTHYLNKELVSEQVFKWQSGYGVFSLGSKQLDVAVNYVKRQKEHHAQGTAIASLEKCSEPDNPPQKFLGSVKEV